jgi:hypothetical protein
VRDVVNASAVTSYFAPTHVTGITRDTGSAELSRGEQSHQPGPPPLRTTRRHPRAGRHLLTESEAVPLRYAAELIGVSADSEKAIRWLIALIVMCCDCWDCADSRGFGAAINHRLKPYSSVIRSIPAVPTRSRAHSSYGPRADVGHPSLESCEVHSSLQSCGRPLGVSLFAQGSHKSVVCNE